MLCESDEEKTKMNSTGFNCFRFFNPEKYYI